MAVTNTAAALAELKKTVAAGGGGGGGALSGLSDVTLTAPALNQVLTYNGTRWVNQAPSGGPVTSYATTISVPYGSVDYQVSVNNASIGLGANIFILPGVNGQFDENEPSDVDVRVVSVPSGSFIMRLSSKGRETIGGIFKFIYLIG